MDDKKGLRAAKYACYGMLLLVLYTLQTTPGLFVIAGIKPNLVIPAALTIAMLEGEFLGGIYGAFAGLLCDLNGPALFGFYAILLLTAGVLAGLAFLYLLQPRLTNFILLTASVLLICGLLEYLFYYEMWDYPGAWRILAGRTLPVVLYSTGCCPVVYGVCRQVFRWFASRLEE